MRIAIVGAGALGGAYGALLATRANVSVTLVVREARADDRRALVLERADKSDVLRWENPGRSAGLPRDADVVLVAVRGDQLDDALATELHARDVPAVVLTPMMPQDYARMRAAIGSRVIAAMPSVTSYVAREDANEIVIRYWLPRLATTLIDQDTRPVDAAIAELVTALSRAGMSARLEMGVHEINPATTITFLPLAFAVDVAGGIDALLADGDLLDLAIAAAREAGEIGLRVGKPAAWASMLSKFVSPTMAKIGIALAKKKSLEAVTYFENHFGRKLHTQNVAMAQSIVAIARDKSMKHDAIDALVTKLREVRS